MQKKSTKIHVTLDGPLMPVCIRLPAVLIDYLDQDARKTLGRRSDVVRRLLVDRLVEIGVAEAA